MESGEGDKEQVKIVNSKSMGSLDLNALALGNSVGTPDGGITADVIEVKSLDEVEHLGREKIEGKIVFYNRPMDPTQIRTFNAYGGAVDQRVFGASKAARPEVRPLGCGSFYTRNICLDF